MGWAKWGFPSCAEWLSWRCGISLSAAREKVRTAQALRDLPGISLAFREGRLSYTKVRALTRVAALHDEDALLRYALDATAPQVEERCRQIRNVQPDSVHDARRAWDARSLSAWRNTARGTLCLRAELPLDVGEFVLKAHREGVGEERWRGGRCRNLEVELPGSTGRCLGRHREDISRRRCDRIRPRAPLRRPIVIRSSCMSTKRPSMEGLGERMCPSRR